jgi:hypothetical protein
MRNIIEFCIIWWRYAVMAWWRKSQPNLKPARATMSHQEASLPAVGRGSSAMGPAAPAAANKFLSEEDRKAAFRALTEAQDQGVSVARSRADVAAIFGISEEQVFAIEGEGVDKNWPPFHPPRTGFSRPLSDDW